jgi:transcriptional regulator GlxA family with amidase domain
VDRQEFSKTLAEACQKTGWQEADLEAGRKSDPLKLEITARLRRETTLSLKAIAARVHLGNSKAANRSLHRHMGGAPSSEAGQLSLGL